MAMVNDKSPWTRAQREYAAHSLESSLGLHIEEIISAFYHQLVKAGDKVIDGGAHDGLHTIPLAKIVGPTGRVYAFEPVPHLASELEAKCREFNNVVIREIAISDFDGTTQFHYVKNYPGYSGIRQRGYPEGALVELLDVPVAQLDTLFPELEGVSFIKLDLEGGEFRALKGAQKLISRTEPLVIFEHGGRAAAKLNDYSIDAFFSFWHQLRYSLFDIFGKALTKAKFSSPSSWVVVAAKTKLHKELIGSVDWVIASAAAAQNAYIATIERKNEDLETEGFERRAEISTLQQTTQEQFSQIASLKFRLEQHSQRAIERQAHIAKLESEIEQLSQQLAAIRVSRSWRYTAPIRFLVDKLRGLRVLAPLKNMHFFL